MQSKKVLLSGRAEDQYEELLQGLLELHEKANGPLRLEKEFNTVKKEWVIHLRTRTWSEFLYESICAYPEEKAAIKKEVLNALEHAFRPMILAARVAALRDFNKQPQGDVNWPVANNKSQGEGTHDDEDHVYISLKNAEKTYGGSSLIVEPSQYVQAMEALLHRLKTRALGVETPVYKSNGEIKADFSSVGRNVLTDTPSFGFTRLSALDFVANNVIVGSVNALIAGKDNPGSSSSLKRAISAFKKGWNAAKSRVNPIEFTEGNNTNSKDLPRTTMTFSLTSLMSVNGLEHIENLYCIPDDLKRDFDSGVKNWGSVEWKKFYLTGCEEMSGSIVRELYPNFYTRDESSGGKIIPYYSDANVAGAVEAALELSSLSREGGENPIAFMFAGLNDSAYEKIRNFMEKRQADKNLELESVSTAKKVLRPVLSANAPTPQRIVQETQEKEKAKLFNSNEQGLDSPLLIDDENSSADDDLSDESELDSTGNKTRGIQKKDADSNTRHVLGQLMSDAKRNFEESRRVKKITEVSLKISELPIENLAEVLQKLDGNRLYEALEIMLARSDCEEQQSADSSSEDFMDAQNTSKQETPQRPSRPALPDGVPTPSAMLARPDFKEILNNQKKDLVKHIPQFNLNIDGDQ